MGRKRLKTIYRRTVLRLSDLDNAKSAVLNSLTSSSSRRVYEHAIEEFIAWYCSEPRLAFNRIVVVRYRIHLEARKLAAATINQRLAAVRRMAHEAADSGLLSPELAAGIQRVKGAKQLGHRSGNWLTLAAFSHHTAQAMWKLAKLQAKGILARQGRVTDHGWLGRRLCFRSRRQAWVHLSNGEKRTKTRVMCKSWFFSPSAVAQSTWHGSAGTTPHRDSLPPAKPTPYAP